MQILLDTHTFLWWLGDSARLSRKALECISDGENDIYLSAVSIWEIRIKEKLGKLKTPKNLLETAEAQGILQIEMTWRHADATKALPNLHKDPFDRLLIAQARSEGLKILTDDTAIKRYDVPTVW